jgi:predicted ATP-grasp superfamily ATP-dependent carboligase
VVCLVNGRLVGKDRLELSELYRVMLTSWWTLKDIHCQNL